MCFSAHELLLQGDDFGTLGLFVLEFLDLVGDFGFVVSTWLNRSFGVSNLLQDATILFEVLGEVVFLFAEFGEENTEFVGDVGDGIIASGFAPVRELRGDGDALAAGGLISADGVVFAFDDFEELLA